MRVITGTARGKKLKSLDGMTTRPTSDMVKEAMFSIIQFEVPSASILDLFAGSGQLGIEALSRGAKHCVFVEHDRDALAVVKQNLLDCKFVNDSRVVNMDSLEYLKVAKNNFDIAILDPPYNMGILEKALPILEPLMNENSVVICEHERELELPQSIGKLEQTKRYRYGKIVLTVYRIAADETGDI